MRTFKYEGATREEALDVAIGRLIAEGMIRDGEEDRSLITTRPIRVDTRTVQTGFYLDEPQRTTVHVTQEVAEIYIGDNLTNVLIAYNKN